MGNTSSQYDRRRAEILEALVELYMRPNGYFRIRNYLQHLVDGFGLDTESDLLAIRMPHQEEVLPDGRRQRNDEIPILPKPIADCVIAEVREPSVEFNPPLRRPDGARLIAAALRMFGVLPSAAFEKGGVAHERANALHQQINNVCWVEIPSVEFSKTHGTEYGTSVRMVVFAPEIAKHAEERKHFDLQHVLAFTRSRLRLGEPCAAYRDPAFPTASPWR